MQKFISYICHPNVLTAVQKILCSVENVLQSLLSWHLSRLFVLKSW